MYSSATPRPCIAARPSPSARFASLVQNYLSRAASLFAGIDMMTIISACLLPTLFVLVAMSSSISRIHELRQYHDHGVLLPCEKD